MATFLLRQLLHRIHILKLLRSHAEYFLVARLLLHGYVLSCAFAVQVLELWQIFEFSEGEICFCCGIISCKCRIIGIFDGQIIFAYDTVQVHEGRIMVVDLAAFTF